MANLLDLVDQLIGSVLKGNIYTDVDTYRSLLLQRPADADVHVPNIDPRNLNIPVGTTHPHADSKVIPPPPHSPPPMSRGDIYNPGGTIPPNTLEQSKNAPVPLSKDIDTTKIYEQSNHLNRKGNPLDALMDFHDSRAKDSSFQKGQSFQDRRRFYDAGKEQQIKSNIAAGGIGPENIPISKPSAGDELALRGSPPSDTEAQKNTMLQAPGFEKGKAFDESRRDGIYAHTEKNTQIKSNIGGTEISKPTMGDLKSSQGLPPAPDLLFKGPDAPSNISPLTPSQIAGFAKGKSFDEIVRADTYKNPDPTIGAGPNVGPNSIPSSNPTVGDIRSSRGAPPTPSLLFKGQDDAPPRQDLVGTAGETAVFDRSGRGGIIAQNDFTDEFGVGGKFASMSQRPVPPELRFADIFAVAHWARNIGRNLFGVGPESDQPSGNVGENIEKRIRGITFIAEQFLLASLNPGGIGVSGLGLGAEESNALPTNAIYNPLAIPAAMIARVYNPDIAPIVVGGSPLLGGGYQAGLIAKMTVGQDLMASPEGGEQFSQRKDLPGYSLIDSVPIPKRLKKLASSVLGSTTPLDAAFPGEKDENLIENTPISDGEIYLPFMFQDLRDDPPKFLYFRAFLKPGLAETFTPDWQIDRYYGRVDQVPIYMGTIRNLNIGFDVVAWTPSDLPVIWKKMKKLQSMVYPTYTATGFMKSGPIIRMRVGDLLATQAGKGLPGYITSMDWSYDDGIWNMKVDEKVPRKISVSIGFTVLHDGNPGIYPYKEGTHSIPDDETKASTEGTTFGAGNFKQTENGKNSISISTSEIRKIFTSIKDPLKR